jgi:hypothetical protein
MFFKFLEKIGRCHALTSPDGTVLALRYFLLRKEDGQKHFLSDKLPNIWMHKMLQSYSPDDGIMHRHPWATATIIVKGGYNEVLETGERRELRAGSVSLRSSKTGHYIEEVIPGGWSIFAHWVKRQEWKFLVDDSAIEFDEHQNNFDQSNEWRWIVYNKAGKEKIRKRKERNIDNTKAEIPKIDVVWRN